MRARPRLTALCLALGFLTGRPTPVAAQLGISGQVDLLARSGSDDRGLNRNFHLDSPYSQARLRLFFQHWVTERIGVFGELLYDFSATGPRVNGAYVVVNEIAGTELVNARVGLAPSPLGNFGLHSTYFNANPVIGVPLLWQHRSTLDGSGLARNEDLIRRREQNVIGLPLLYDACWSIQWGLMGHRGPFEYALTATSGATSNPGAASEEDGVQLLARVGLEPVAGIRFGVSGGYGPYIGGGLHDPLTLATSFPGRPDDYVQKVAGYDVEVARGKWRVASEGFVGSWEVPLVLEEELRAVAGYVEARWDFLPAWYGGLRLGTMRFGDISSTNAGTGPRTGWDDDVARTEAALGYRVAREVLVRVGWQHTDFLTGGEEDVDLLAVQLQAVF